jgi:hypothetical protein
MALARCETCGCPRRTKRAYIYSHRPLSYPNRGVICGAPTCMLPACIWLTNEEEREYLRGSRSFRLGNRTTQVQVT